jgi:hypothetical protein
MPINMFLIVKNHWDPYFTDHPRIYSCALIFLFSPYYVLCNVGLPVQSVVVVMFVVEALSVHCVSLPFDIIFSQQIR